MGKHVLNLYVFVVTLSMKPYQMKMRHDNLKDSPVLLQMGQELVLQMNQQVPVKMEFTPSLK